MLGKSPSPLAIHFGAALRQLRLEAGLTQEALGFEAHLQRNYISKLELGEYQPTLTTLYKLAAALRITPCRLLEVTGLHRENFPHLVSNQADLA